MDTLPEVNMDMKTLAMCTSTEPTTCFDTSKNQILSGRCGRSLQRLYTNDSNANPPRASWTMRAKGPSRRHSPVLSAPSPLCCGERVDVGTLAVAVAEGVMVTTIAPTGGGGGTGSTPTVAMAKPGPAPASGAEGTAVTTGTSLASRATAATTCPGTAMARSGGLGGTGSARDGLSRSSLRGSEALSPGRDGGGRPSTLLGSGVRLGEGWEPGK